MTFHFTLYQSIKIQFSQIQAFFGQATVINPKVRPTYKILILEMIFFNLVTHTIYASGWKISNPHRRLRLFIWWRKRGRWQARKFGMEGGGQDLFDQIYFELELVTNLTKYFKIFCHGRWTTCSKLSTLWVLKRIGGRLRENNRLISWRSKSITIKHWISYDA